MKKITDALKEYFIKEHKVPENKVDVMENLCHFFDNLIEEDWYRSSKKKVVELKNLYEGLTLKEIKIIKNIKKEIESGENIDKYFSKTKKKLTTGDRCKSTYGIDHLHIGGNVAKNSYVKRSDKLLFIHNDKNLIYFICVLSHPKGKEWGGVDALKKLYSEHSHLFTNCIRTSKMEPILTEDNYKELFKLKINFFIEIEKGVYTQGVGNSFGSNYIDSSLIGTLYKNKFLNKSMILGPNLKLNYLFEHKNSFFYLYNKNYNVYRNKQFDIWIYNLYSKKWSEFDKSLDSILYSPLPKNIF